MLVAALLVAALILKNSIRKLAGPWLDSVQSSVVVPPTDAGAAEPLHAPVSAGPVHICGEA